MANDNRANYAKIGLAVILGVLATLGTLVYLAGIGDGDNEFLVETYSDDPVDGLSVGSAVNFRGVKIGEVRRINFVSTVYMDEATEADAQRIWILMALDTRKFAAKDDTERRQIIDRFVKRGLRVTVAQSGITGLARLELGVPKTEVPAAVLAWRPRYPLVPPSPSLMNSLSDAIRLAIDRFNKMDIASAWSNIASVAKSSAQVANGANRLMESQRGGIGSIVRNVDDASQSVRDLSERLRDNPSLILRTNDPEPLPETAR